MWDSFIEVLWTLGCSGWTIALILSWSAYRRNMERFHREQLHWHALIERQQRNRRWSDQ